MKRTLILQLLVLLVAATATAQGNKNFRDDFDKFKKKARQEYSDFRKQCLAEYAEFVRTAGRNMEQSLPSLHHR